VSSEQHIDTIALTLDEDVHGVFGILTEKQVRERLVDKVRMVTNYPDDDMVHMHSVASMISNV
jgi:hypothetical protein